MSAFCYFCSTSFARYLTIREVHLELQQRALPYCLITPWNHALPALEIECALRRLHGFCDEAEGVIFAPLLTVGSSVTAISWRYNVQTYRSSCNRFIHSDILYYSLVCLVDEFGVVVAVGEVAFRFPAGRSRVIGAITDPIQQRVTKLWACGTAKEASLLIAFHKSANL